MPRCTLVLGAKGARGKTTLALRVAGYETRETFPTPGIDLLFHEDALPRQYVVDTPEPSGTLHPATRALLQDATDALVAHSRHAEPVDTHRLILALKALSVPALLVVQQPADALHCGVPVACVSSAVDARRAMRRLPCEAPLLCAALCTARMPRLAHAALLAACAAASAVPVFVRPHRNVQHFLMRAQQCGGEPYATAAPPPPLGGKGSAAAALALGACVATIEQPATAWTAFALPANALLGTCVRGPIAVEFAWKPARVQLSALGLLAMLQATRTPLPRATQTCTFALAAVLALAGAPVHAGPPLLAAAMRGSALPHEDVALVIAGLVAREAHLAVLLAVAAAIALEDDARALRAGWSAWLAPLLLLLTFG